MNRPMFTEEQVQRYARHIILPNIGGAGQRKLLDASVLVIGAGGLGSPIAMYLAAAGVGRLGVVDFDRVDLTNLQRQILHGTSDVGRPKVASAADATICMSDTGKRRGWRRGMVSGSSGRRIAAPDAKNRASVEKLIDDLQKEKAAEEERLRREKEAREKEKKPPRVEPGPRRASAMAPRRTGSTPTWRDR